MVDGQGVETKRVHVFGPSWNVLPNGWEGVEFGWLGTGREVWRMVFGWVRDWWRGGKGGEGRNEGRGRENKEEVFELGEDMECEGCGMGALSSMGCQVRKDEERSDEL